MFPFPSPALDLSLWPKNKHFACKAKMAVEAQYLHLFHPQLYKNRDSMNSMENATCILGNQMGSTGPAYNSVTPTMNEIGFVVNENNILSRKRSWDSFSFLDEDLSSQIYNQMLDIDRLLIQHMVNVRMDLSHKRKRFSNQIIATVNESFSKQLKSKDEEIEQLRKLNQAMEERVTSLSVESNAWKYLAQSHETAVASLSANLELVLADKTVATTDDAASCCEDNNSNENWRRTCRKCGDGEPSVLLLPCRHLCLCTVCGQVADTCPICKCRLAGSVNVNLC